MASPLNIVLKNIKIKSLFGGFPRFFEGNINNSDEMEENIMPDTNFGNPFMANMSENPVHKIVVEVRNKAVPTRADVM